MGCGYQRADEWPMPLRDYEEEERLAREEAAAPHPPPQPSQPQPPPPPTQTEDATEGAAARQQQRSRQKRQTTRHEDESAGWNAEFFGGKVEELQRTLDAKTDEFNALRQRLMRPVVYDDGVAVELRRWFP